MSMISSKRGSALLIVLGMLAFMVISAVAFSAYMRYARLPSSFLRRSSASRLLAKAAIAEAIDELDAAIGNNPHPGVGNRVPRMTAGLASTGLGTSVNMDSRTRNHWRNRIYIGTNQLFEVDQTVSTLTLEGLAYIPPSLVNEARYYSRRSQAGRWKKLGFDSGRYAFCAIDVSDFFDVNALAANYARASAPSRRLSLAYLFENAGHTTSKGSSGTPAQWDRFMQQFTDSGKVPLVSLADWNLAINKDMPGGMQSQFCQYILENRTSFYGGIGERGEQAEAIRNQAFITDSWFPPSRNARTSSSSSGTGKILDLNSGSNQPFTMSELRGNKSLFAIAAGNALANNQAINQFEQSISGLGFAALYDYLDKDDTPISLAIPTTERVPMICGLSPEMPAANLTIEPQVVTDNQITPGPGGQVAGAPYTITHKVIYKVKGLPTSPTRAIVTYPFRHQDAQNSNTYELGGRMAYFLTLEGEEMGLRTWNVGDVLHVGYRGQTDAINAYEAVENAALTVAFKGQGISTATFNGNSQGPEGAVKSFTLTPNGIVPNEIAILEVTYEGQDTYRENEDTGAVIPNPNHVKIDLSKGDRATQAVCNWKPLTKDGKIYDAFSSDGKLLAALNKTDFSLKLKVNLALWAWVKNRGTNKIVDMVPACVYDDSDLNNHNTDNMSKKWGQDYMGAAYPVMRFDMSETKQSLLSFTSGNYGGNSVVGAGDATQMKVTPEAVMVCDPRYNHAPESWFAYSGTLTESVWLEKNESGYKSKATNNLTRDGDIFMQTSDQEYLQSVYELANLPRLTDFYQAGAKWPDHGWYQNPALKNFMAFTDQVTDTANFDYVWRTYDPFARYQNGGDDFDNAGIVSEGGGFKLNPFSNITNVIMAAFANTPHEWRVASTNELTMSAAGIPDDAEQFNKKYAWNEYGSGAKVKWYDLEDMAGVFMDHVRQCGDSIANGQMTWEDAWFDLGWCDFTKTGEECSKYLLNNMPLEDTSNAGRIWNTDRKFLYGYWHDCFAIRQQLFLVFVRAEPLMMGGGAIGQTPPQLGARAVALVWRDPTSSGDESKPHRTRVLFYRQFD